MKRRKFITLLGGAVAWPFAASGQQRPTTLPIIGIIDDAPIWNNFRNGLRELGYVEGRNIVIEYRSAQGRPDRFVAAATELAHLPVDVIVTWGTTPTQAAKQATATIPIVMTGIGDPVRAGLVASLAHPGGNEQIMKVSSVGLGGPYNPMLRSPVFGQKMFDLLYYLRWQTSVPLKLNEFAILIIGRQWRSQVEWFAHAPLAVKAGLSPEIVAELKTNKRPSNMPPEESAFL
jgi:hypothetical protein